MIQVFDDIVDIFDQEIIKNNLFKEKDWEFIEDVSVKDNKHQQRPGFKIHFKTIIPSINDILLYDKGTGYGSDILNLEKSNIKLNEYGISEFLFSKKIL